MKENRSDFILFKTEDEKISVDVRFEDETVWLTQDQMALLFGKAKSTINEHIQNIFNERELEEALCTQKFGISEFSTKPTNVYLETVKTA
ncbi:MAG: cell filamentation protein Fic [Bacteroidetes bacterium HGW-Bacteroidetes-22]|nr:MAG: cell filamentation protein Fic [Bacteroidetes bacterium HGW-Bacteroidetes-22]